MHKKKVIYYYKYGFTLIEMAIVLVILGLIIGGIIAGQSMIKSAEMREQITELDNYKKAVATFEETYGGLPGDITNAATLFTGAINGNGSGFIDASINIFSSTNNPDNPYYDLERPQFFIQLNLAGLIPQRFDGTAILGNGYPRVILNPAGGMFAAGPWITSGGNNQYGSINLLSNATLYMAINVSNPQAFNVDTSFNETSGIFTTTEAWQMDSKIDDSVPSTGKVTAQALSPPVTCCTATAYNLAGGSTRACNLNYELKQ